MYPESASDVIMPPYAQGIVLYQEFFCCTVFKYADGGIKPLKFDHAQLSQVEPNFLSFLFTGHFTASCDTCRGPNNRRDLRWFLLNGCVVKLPSNIYMYRFMLSLTMVRGTTFCCGQ